MAPNVIRNLVPHREKREESLTLFQAIRSLTALQYLQVFCGWLAWTCDAVDFFSIALSVTRLRDQFHKSTNSSITTAITLTLLFRSLGAVIFGILSDRFGRRWPLVANLLFCCVLQVGTSFVQTYKQFLAVRSLFGIAMGGVWGLAASTALENLPVELRGLVSGIVQQGYAFGYLFAAILNLTLVPVTHHSWRVLFWAAAFMSFTAACIRVVTPESEVFLRVKRLEQERGIQKNKTKVFLHEMKGMLTRHWMRCIYAVLLMTGFNFLSHGSQDLYPTYLQTTKGFTPHQATVATIIGNCGAISGGAIAGWGSQYIGRRLTIILFVILVGAFIPLWILPNTFPELAAGAFCIQFGVQGAWGVIPILLSEISPSAFRATFPGVAYQLGNMISAASAQIEATAGNNLKTTIIQNGKEVVVPDYAKVQGILIGVVAVFVVIITSIGPEQHGAHFEHAKTAVEEGSGRDDMDVDEEHENGGNGWSEKDPYREEREKVDV